MSQLWWWCCCRFLFWGAQGASQLPGCEGEGGQSALDFGGRRGPVGFRAVKGKGASQLWSCLVLRGMEASQLPGAVKGG